MILSMQIICLIFDVYNLTFIIVRNKSIMRGIYVKNKKNRK